MIRKENSAIILSHNVLTSSEFSRYNHAYDYQRVDIWGNPCRGADEVIKRNLIHAANETRKAIGFLFPDSPARTVLEKTFVPHEGLARLAALAQGSYYVEAAFNTRDKEVIDFGDYDPDVNIAINMLSILKQARCEGNSYLRMEEVKRDEPFLVHPVVREDHGLTDILISLPTSDPNISIEIPENSLLLGLTTLRQENGEYSFIVPVFDGKHYTPTGMKINATKEVVLAICSVFDSKQVEVFDKTFGIAGLTQFVKELK